jgi:hypothetical protein
VEPASSQAAHALTPVRCNWPAFISLGFGLFTSALALLSIYGEIGFPSGIPGNYPMPLWESLVGVCEDLLFVCAPLGLIVTAIFGGIGLFYSHTLLPGRKARR